MELKNPYLHSKVIVPAVILAALIVYLTMENKHGPSYFWETRPVSLFFPVMLGIIGIPIAIKLLLDAVKEVKQEHRGNEPEAVKVVTTPFILSIVSYIYIVLFNYIGLIPAVLYICFSVSLSFFDDKGAAAAEKNSYMHF